MTMALKVYLWPINAEEQILQQVKYVIDKVREHKIPLSLAKVQFQINAKQVKEETGAKYGGVLYVDSPPGRWWFYLYWI